MGESLSEQRIIGYFKSGHPIRHSDLQSRSVFIDCDFQKTNFEAIVLSSIRFKSCNFSGASFNDASFNDCLFKDCDLRGVDAENAVFECCHFSNSPLIGSFLFGTQLLETSGYLQFHSSKIQNLRVTSNPANSLFLLPQYKLIGEPLELPEGYFFEQDPWTTFSGRRRCIIGISYNRIINDVVVFQESKPLFRLRSKFSYVGWREGDLEG